MDGNIFIDVHNDYIDAYYMLDSETEKEQISMHKNLISFWKDVQKRIKFAR